MDIYWTQVIYFLFLIDSLGAVIMAWFGRNWWIHATGRFAEFFPPAKGWALLYFALIVFIGFQLGIF